MSPSEPSTNAPVNRAPDGGPGSDADKTVADFVADALVYAPLGLAFDARDLFPDLVSKGRNQVTILKMLGRFAVQQGSEKGRHTLIEIGSQAVSMLPGVSIAAPPDEIDDAAAEVGTERIPAPAPVEPPSGEQVHADVSAPAPAIDVGTLAIPDYDSLSALQVVPRLAGLSEGELDAVGAYEASTRARKTILNKVAQLRAG
jgi:hypothetical protein